MSIQWGRRPSAAIQACVAASPNIGCECSPSGCVAYVNTSRAGWGEAGYMPNTSDQFEGSLKEGDPGFRLSVAGIFAGVGLQADDVITLINGVAMNTVDGIVQLGEWDWGAEEKLEITYLRGGQEYDAGLVL